MYSPCQMSNGGGIILIPPQCLFAVDLLMSSAEQQRNAPNSCKTYQCVDDPADYGILSTKDPSNEIKLKNADKPPVQGADNRKDQSNCIHYITSVQMIGCF